MQKEIKSTNVVSSKKNSKVYLMYTLVKAWISGIFGKKPKFKLTGKNKERVLELIRKFSV
jgi:hypothetical protein